MSADAEQIRERVMQRAHERIREYLSGLDAEALPSREDIHARAWAITIGAIWEEYAALVLPGMTAEARHTQDASHGHTSSARTRTPRTRKRSASTPTRERTPA